MTRTSYYKSENNIFVVSGILILWLCKANIIGNKCPKYKT